MVRQNPSDRHIRRKDSPSWKEKKPVGDGGERRVLSWLSTRCTAARVVPGRSSHDIEATLRIEVKTDIAAEKSGNAAVEVECGGQPSGIMTSRSHLWFHVVGDEMFIVLTAKLRSLVATGLYNASWGGDGSRTKLFLVPLSSLRHAAHVVHLPPIGGAG